MDNSKCNLKSFSRGGILSVILGKGKRPKKGVLTNV